ncbi:MAG TPA: NAD(P)H-hydrate dehydratase [Thermoanaerobaculia bacterium]|nr:NAD(P)H-hydrate dehydratase [Thermoanaerobaculia bacterium]
MRLLSAEAMQTVDRAAIDELGIPGPVLMENAAIGVVDAIGESFPDADSVAIFCGPGNNGGDGLAVARHLAVRGYDVYVFLVFSGRKPSADAKAQLAICRKMELPIEELRCEEDEDDDDLVDAIEAARETDLIVDALFGTGLARPLDGAVAILVDGLNDLPVPRVAVDIPSGLHGSRGEIFGPHVEADLTVTFAAPKIAHVFPPAAGAVGELVVADLGIPPSLVEAAPGGLHLLDPEELEGLLPERDVDGHKGDYGHALLVAGSPGKAGAAILAARAAVRVGAGLVTVAVPEPLLATVDLGSVESMTLPLPAGPSGQLAAAAVDRLLAFAQGKSALALGPGLGQETETAEAIRRLVQEADLPLVLDADGLNAFAGRAGEIAGRAAQGRETVLTPHPGEMGRLLGIPTASVQADRIAAVRRAARETRAVVVLKGHLSLIAVPEAAGEDDGDEGDGEAAVYVNPTGNPGMATGGTGDVLTGILVGLLAQGLAAPEAAQLGVYLHGLAGDFVAERFGGASGQGRGLAAGDLVEALPAAFQKLAAAGE